MRAVRTARANFVWVGPTPDVGDLHSFVERDDRGMVMTTSVWEPSLEERARIGRGENIALRVLGAHPPVLIYVTDEQGIGEDAPEVRARLEQWSAGASQS